MNLTFADVCMAAIVVILVIALVAEPGRWSL